MTERSLTEIGVVSPELKLGTWARPFARGARPSGSHYPVTEGDHDVKNGLITPG